MWRRLCKPQAIPRDSSPKIKNQSLSFGAGVEYNQKPDGLPSGDNKLSCGLMVAGNRWEKDISGRDQPCDSFLPMSHKIRLNKIFRAGAILVGIIFGIILLTKFFGGERESACSAEAKLCSDGTAVGRSGPACEFTKCPGEGKNDLWKTVINDRTAPNMRLR